MKETNENPLCCNHPVTSERSRPQRGDVYWYLSNSLFDINRAQWDDDGTDEGRWRVGNVFGSLEQAERARKKITEVLLNVHKDHASPRMVSP
jgi:hypothetical protein